MAPLRVLLVNHTAQVSGAEHSLIALSAGLAAKGVDCTLACPSKGPLNSMALESDLPTRKITGTEGSLQLHPTQMIKAAGEIGLSAFQIAGLARVTRADLIHANSLRAGLSSGIGAWGAGIPGVVHLRDRLPANPASTACLRLMEATNAAVIANSDFTADSFSEAGIDRPPTVIGNPVDLDRFRPTSREERDAVRARLGLTSETIALGVVGQIAPWKAQGMAIEALRRLSVEIPTLRLLIVGDAKFPAARQDNAGYLDELLAAARDPAISGRVDFLGERRDVPEILGALDALLLPSIREPFGRVLVEAMAVGTPVVASAEGGPAEIIENMATGLLVDRHDPEAWAATIRSLVTDPHLRRRLASAALRKSGQYSLQRHAEQVLTVYERLMDRGPARA